MIFSRIPATTFGPTLFARLLSFLTWGSPQSPIPITIYNSYLTEQRLWLRQVLRERSRKTGNTTSSHTTFKRLFAATSFFPLVVTQQVFNTTPLSFEFVNIEPFFLGHVLVSPLRPVEWLSELTDAEAADLFVESGANFGTCL